MAGMLFCAMHASPTELAPIVELTLLAGGTGDNQ